MTDSSLQRRTAQPFRTVRAAPAAPRSRRHLQCRAGNLLVELLGSGVGAAAVTAVTTFTSENRDQEIERLQVCASHLVPDSPPWTFHGTLSPSV